MKTIVKSGRYLFALATTGLGMIMLITTNFPSTFLPLPGAFEGRSILVYFTGALLVVSGISILIDRLAVIAATVVGVLFFLFVLFPHVPNLISHPRDPGAWTVMFETVAISSGAFMLVALLMNRFPGRYQWYTAAINISRVARYAFAVALVIFGIQHIMYADFIVTLIPSWIPAHSFWSFVVQAAFLAAAMSILIRFQVPLATFLLGTMFSLWVILLHLPRVANNSGKETEWTSLFIALAMAGIFFIVNEVFKHEGSNFNLNSIARETTIDH